jgi:cellulose synthase/poly-beta-1,6-N-acetylglucosamine synthase-like glycosyltransferase
MHSVPEWIFWISLLLGVYPYALYPLAVKLLGGGLRRRVLARDEHLPRVTVLTAAFNEARHIEATIRNKLAQDYPAELIDVIVISDESTDGTDDIVNRIAAETGRVRLLRQAPRAGKTSALNLAMPGVQGEIVVFSDANSIYRQDAIRKLVRNFADPQVGYVTGKMVYVNPDGSLVGDGCSAYMRYENELRQAETAIGSIVGVDGGVDAVRAALYRPMRADQLPDFVLPLNVVEQGYRVIFEPQALLSEDALTSQGSEYRMRVRVALRAFWALWDKRALLNPLRYGVFAWQLWSHKLLRYVSFIPLALAAIINWWLWPVAPVYQVFAVGQLAFALLVFIAWAGPGFFNNNPLSRYSYYFFLLNWSSAVAFGRFLAGKKQALWTPRAG